MELKFRTLRADEIECRVQSVYANGLILLLYKDARCDMNLLDEVVGAMNWERHHSEIKGNLYCAVSIYDAQECHWVEKSDCGTESNTEKEKGEASDSFKRACTNWGIGRELYTAPFIWIPPSGYKAESKNGKPTTKDKFSVGSIAYRENVISALTILNDSQGGREVFRYEAKAKKPKAEPKPASKPKAASKTAGKPKAAAKAEAPITVKTLYNEAAQLGVTNDMVDEIVMARYSMAAALLNEAELREALKAIKDNPEKMRAWHDKRVKKGKTIL